MKKKAKNAAPAAPVAIYIYIYVGELLVCPRFGLQRVNRWAPGELIGCPRFRGAFSH